MGLEYKQVPTDQVDNTGTPYQYAEVDDDGVVHGYRRADGDWDIPVNLDPETEELVTRAAELEGITVEEFLNRAAKEMLTRMIEEKRAE